jgi:hypothetical protein
VGKWLEKNGDCAYGKLFNFTGKNGIGNRLCSLSMKGNTVYAWAWIWPAGDEFIIAGFSGKLKSAKILATGQSLPFVQEKYRIILGNLPPEGRDPIAGVTVFALEFEGEPAMTSYASQPPLCLGREYQ